MDVLTGMCIIYYLYMLITETVNFVN